MFRPERLMHLGGKEVNPDDPNVWPVPPPWDTNVYIVDDAGDFLIDDLSVYLVE